MCYHYNVVLAVYYGSCLAVIASAVLSGSGGCGILVVVAQPQSPPTDCLSTWPGCSAYLSSVAACPSVFTSVLHLDLAIQFFSVQAVWSIVASIAPPLLPLPCGWMTVAS